MWLINGWILAWRGTLKPPYRRCTGFKMVQVWYLFARGQVMLLFLLLLLFSVLSCSVFSSVDLK